MIARVHTFTLLGVEAIEVSVEVDVAEAGLPAFSLVGLPDTSVRESRERVRAAIEYSGFRFPKSRIVASLAPADLRKAGPGFDLAIAAGVLLSSGQLQPDALDGCAMAAELALDGSVRAVPGAIAMAERAGELGFKKIVVASSSAAEAAMPAALGAHPCRVVPIESLADLTRIGAPDEPSYSPPELRSGRSRLASGHRPRGAPRATRASPGARGCGRRRPRDLDPWAARRWEEPRGTPAADDHAAARRSGGDGSASHRQRLRSERLARERLGAESRQPARSALRTTRSRPPASSVAERHLARER